jgi:ribosomal protein S17E
MSARPVLHGDSDSLILRFPTGITESETHQNLKKFLKILFEAIPYDFITRENQINRAYLKPNDPMYDKIVQNTIRGWITNFMMDPSPNRPRKEIPSDPRAYTLSVRIGDTVYANIFPCGTAPNDEGYYVFACPDKLDI